MSLHMVPYNPHYVDTQLCLSLNLGIITVLQAPMITRYKQLSPLCILVLIPIGHHYPSFVTACTNSPVVEEVYLAPEYICHFFLDSLSTDSSDFKSAGCQVGKFGQFDI